MGYLLGGEGAVFAVPVVYDHKIVAGTLVFIEVHVHDAAKVKQFFEEFVGGDIIIMFVVFSGSGAKRPDR